ncbi:MAG: hypothetical protein EZS26_003763 [Candidatus Ordinivivax streblomastigis]|uniref:Uncharacterized protein n=1 Tax=Candidatus Ordinivivax streblomastigis TaxID=2540710 RepID=A0A5M8NY03_9BACT|nr:MAG: hypothetical protein EZS26_003763 [Candidatus Ordinivivax streblomastigis]
MNNFSVNYRKIVESLQTIEFQMAEKIISRMDYYLVEKHAFEG